MLLQKLWWSFPGMPPRVSENSLRLTTITSTLVRRICLLQRSLCCDDLSFWVIMKKCFICGSMVNIIEFTTDTLRRCVELIATTKTENFSSINLRFSRQTSRNFGYHEKCLEKILVLKEIDAIESEMSSLVSISLN